MVIFVIEGRTELRISATSTYCVRAQVLPAEVWVGLGARLRCLYTSFFHCSSYCMANSIAGVNADVRALATVCSYSRLACVASGISRAIVAEECQHGVLVLCVGDREARAHPLLSLI